MHNQSAYYARNQPAFYRHNQSAFYMHNQSAYYIHNQSAVYCLMVSSSRKEENRRCTRLRSLVYAIFPPEGRVPESEAWSVMLCYGPIHGPITYRYRSMAPSVSGYWRGQTHIQDSRIWCRLRNVDKAYGL